MRSKIMPIFILLCLIIQGCVTSNTWQNTGDSIGHSRVQGFISGSSQGHKEKLDYLVVIYSASSTWPRKSVMYAFAIPCKNGMIPESMVYSGINRSFQAIIDATRKEQLAAIQDWFSPNAEEMGRTILESGRYTESKALVIGNDGDSQSKWDWERNIVVVPYWWKQDGGPKNEYLWWDYVDYKSGYTLDPKCNALLIPCHLPKKKSDRFKDMALAVVETPFSVIADVVLLPFEFIYFASVPG